MSYASLSSTDQALSPPMIIRGWISPTCLLWSREWLFTRRCLIVIPIHTHFFSGKTGGNLCPPQCRYPCYCFILQGEVSLFSCILLSWPTATQAQNILSTMGIVDSGLDALVVENYHLKFEEQVNASLASTRRSNAPPRFLLLYMWRRLNIIARQFHTIKHGNQPKHIHFICSVERSIG